MRFRAVGSAAAARSGGAAVNPVAFLLRHAVFTTRQFAVLCERRVDVASRQLVRMVRQGTLVRLSRGVWAQPEHLRFTPAAAVPLLLGNEQGYVSFLSAMHLHGLIAQIPGRIEVATTGHGRRLDTPVGRYEFLRVQPRMMRQGIDTSTTEPPYNLATGAKALLDALYIATRRGRRFASLPEVDMNAVDRTELTRLLSDQVRTAPIRRAIDNRLAALEAVGSSDGAGMPTRSMTARPSAPPTTLRSSRARWLAHTRRCC